MLFIFDNIELLSAYKNVNVPHQQTENEFASGTWKLQTVNFAQRIMKLFNK